MASYAAMTFASFSGTPANFNFGVYRPYGGETTPAVWIDRTNSQGIALGFKRIECGLRRANGSSSYKVPLKVVFPIVKTVDGVTKISHTLMFDGTFTLPDQTTEDERADLASAVANAIQQAQVFDAIRYILPPA